MLSWPWYTAAVGGIRTREVAGRKSGTVPLGYRVTTAHHSNNKLARAAF